MLSRLRYLVVVLMLLIPISAQAQYIVSTGFEEWLGHNYESVSSKIYGFLFSTTTGSSVYFADMNAKVMGNHDWYGVTSVDTARVSGDGEYYIYGQMAAYVLDGNAVISFINPAKYVEIRYSSFFDIFLECYSADGSLIDTIAGAPCTRTTPEGSPASGPGILSISRNDGDIAYVVVRSEPGYWLIDNVSALVPEPGALLALGVGLVGLLGRFSTSRRK